jgi:cytidylate kinase
MSSGVRVAIDGPMGAGKGTVARLVARRLGYRYVDTGAMYRAVAWKALREGVDLDDPEAVASVARRARVELEPEGDGLRVRCDGEDVTEAIRSVQVSAVVGRVAANPAVRKVLTDRQRELARGGGVVMEGRDIGTVVLPDAEVKVFLEAPLAERARRRYEELRERGESVSLEAVQELVRRDDELARGRATAPLRRAEDAVVVDTTGRSPEEVAEEIVRLVERRVGVR